MKISFLHPFSAKAIGFDDEKYLHDSHSIPHVNALSAFRKRHPSYQISVDYFTNRLYYTKNVEGLKKVFWPLTNLKGKGKWRKEKSFVHYLHSLLTPPDLTIINMSGHGSHYAFKLAELIRKKHKKYIAMVGGIHMSFKERAYEYYKNSASIIVHTQKQKNQILNYRGFEKFNIQVLHLGVDTRIFKPLKDYHRYYKMVYVGRLSRVKQIEKAIHALHFCRQNGLQYSLDIIGPISDKAYYHELKKMVKIFDIEDSICFKQPLEQKDLLSYYQTSDVLLLPSKHESFGMVITEAMACGTPTVAIFGSTGPEEIIKHGVNGMISKNNYSLDVFNLLKDPILHQKMSRNCIVSVAQQWSQKITNEKLENYIRSVL